MHDASVPVGQGEESASGSGGAGFLPLEPELEVMR